MSDQVIKKAINETIRLYSNTGWKSLFTKWKFWEEPYEELEKLIPDQGKIIDLGCGEGILANFLVLSSNKRKVLGFEIDKTRLAVANRNIPNTEFKQADITKLTIPAADVLTMFHVLHHLSSYEQQEDVLRNCYKALKKNGKLLIVDVEIKPSLKYWTCWFADHFLVPWVFEGRFFAPAFFRNSKNWKKFLDEVGFKTKIIPAEAGRPFSNVILECIHP
ncbi:MAG: class I SAM-dependent methyltransferase [Candidatus Daviesbacteria bacterium]|nr:class I SAM-dependent methyltransferase [Candidatus Daviesbacteria bacterium]